MRDIPETFDPAVVAEIDARLDGLAFSEGIRLPLAVESGSRAWGFPSPDSDYDCRFLFVRQADAYLSLWPRRDVVETPLDGMLDVNGWDLRKALQLMVKGNAVVLEWLRSPIVYRADDAFVASCQEIAEQVADRAQVARHYLHVGRAQWGEPPSDEILPSLKRAFYALRPALALRWMRHHGHEVVPPMTLPQLAVEAGLSAGERRMIDEMVEIKARTRDAATSIMPGALADVITREFVEEDWIVRPRPDDDTRRARALADEFFLDLVGRGPR